MAGYKIGGTYGYSWNEEIDDGTMCRARTPAPGPNAPLPERYAFFLHAATPMTSLWRHAEPLPPPTAGKSATESVRKAANTLDMSAQGLKLLQEVEGLRLKPYNDQTGKEVTGWVAGATIGYGHLIALTDWDKYKKGLTESEADALLKKDLAPFMKIVGANVTVSLTQNEFDALVFLAFNIGPAFATSSVANLVNDPKAKTPYKNLEAAWKAWNTSQGKVMKGLENRRQCEWKIYTDGVYKRW